VIISFKTSCSSAGQVGRYRVPAVVVVQEESGQETITQFSFLPMREIYWRNGEK